MFLFSASLVIVIGILSFYLIGFGGHDVIQHRILREMILEGNDGIPVKKKSFPFIAVRDKGQLVRTDIELLRQDLAVAACLVQYR